MIRKKTRKGVEDIEKRIWKNERDMTNNITSFTRKKNAEKHAKDIMQRN